MSNKSLNKANTNLTIENFTKNELNKIGVVLNELNIPFEGFESINLEKIIDGLKSKNEISILSNHQGFDTNELYFNLRDGKIRVEIQPNSFYVKGGNFKCSKMYEKFYNRILGIYLN